jgi:uncharacterized membrane protein
MNKSNIILISIIILSLIGSVIASYGLYLHYQPLDGSSFCNINEVFNCDAVNKSAYSKFLGFPVALIGLGGYLFFILISLMDLKNFFGKPTHKLMLFLATLGFLFTLYLTYLEAFVIFAWCVVCIGSAIVMTIIFILTMLYYRESERRPKVEN